MTLANNSKREWKSSAESSFEETYKTAYSHGLEAIYALENVDPKSIRRIEQPLLKEVPKKRDTPPKQCAAQEQQLEFDLGPPYRTWIAPFLKKEPIQVLGLSPLAERCLLSNDKKLLRDILETDLQKFIFFKGMGQGYIDEIQHKLNLYIDGVSLHRSQAIDFVSWLRTLVAALDRKKTALALQSYKLITLFSLSPLENGEVNRLTPEKRHEWIQEMTAQFQMTARNRSVIADMKEIADVFVKPWMRRRLGIAAQHELSERLHKASVQADIASDIIHFFSVMYFNNLFPLHPYLQSVDPLIYCVDEISADHYDKVRKKALSYFYKSTTQYPLQHLISLIERECARNWQGFSEGFTEKVLRYSPQFQVRKNAQNVLIVRLS